MAAEEATPPQVSGAACIEAAKEVEKEKGLPPGLLWGLSLNETGRIGPDGRFGPAPAVVTAGMNRKGGINSWDFSGNPEKAKAKAREILATKKTNSKRCPGPTFRRDQGGANLPDRMIGRTVCVYARPYA
ncbi:hypothetical protein GAY28_01530 [Azospirillum brasilense]|nr:hypothetical protein [Azospirillum brasilense]